MVLEIVYKKEPHCSSCEHLFVVVVVNATRYENSSWLLHVFNKAKLTIDKQFFIMPKSSLPICFAGLTRYMIHQSIFTSLYCLASILNQDPSFSLTASSCL
jgi:hypothetical protein